MLIKGCKAWVEFLDKNELPVLSQTLQSIYQIAESDNGSLAEMAEVVLRDADLTSGVIKLANTSVYNPNVKPITTISRAVVQIGFDNIKSIAISSTLVDKLTTKTSRHHLMYCLMRSFHAAMYARYLASHLEEETREEVFVAALLFDIGEAAFWASTHPQTSKLEDVLKSSKDPKTSSQREILGTTFSAITKGLIKSWHLGRLLQESIDKPQSEEARIVKTAVAIAHLSKTDWKGEYRHPVFKAAAKLTGKSSDQIVMDLKQQARQAILLANELGIEIKASKPAKKEQKNDMSKHSSRILEALLQISTSISKENNFDKTVKLAVNGLQQALDLDRVGFFVAKRSEPNQFVLTQSSDNNPITKDLNKRLSITPANPIYLCLQNDHSSMLSNEQIGAAHIYNHPAQAPFYGLIPALIGPIRWEGRLYGFVYADRLNKSGITIEQSTSFQLFLQQIMFSLVNHLSLANTQSR